MAQQRLAGRGAPLQVLALGPFLEGRCRVVDADREMAHDLGDAPFARKRAVPILVLEVSQREEDHRLEGRHLPADLHAPATAMHSISTRAPRARPLPATVDRA